jgi:hypothetical protein
MNFVSKFFKLWRGGFKFTISFVKSNFHNARVRLMYRPYISSGTYADPTEQQSCDLENITLDLSNQSEVTFIIPFQQQTEFMDVFPLTQDLFTSPFAQTSTNGLFQIMLINTLTSSFSTINPIYYQVWVSATDDIEFALTSVDNLLTTGFIAQVGETTTVSISGECKTVVCSNDNLQNAPAQILGLGGKYLSNYTRCASQVGSLLALSKMLQPKGYVTGSATVPYSFTINPSADLQLRTHPFSGQSYLHFMSQLQTVFRFWRGGQRFSLIPDGNTYSASTTLDYTDFPYYGSTSVSTPYLSSQTYTGSSLVVFENTTIQPIDVVIPYNSRLNCKLTCENVGSYEGSTGQTLRVNIVPQGGSLVSGWLTAPLVITGSVTSPTYSSSGVIYSIYQVYNNICTYMVCYSGSSGGDTAGSGDYILLLPVPIDTTKLVLSSPILPSNNIGFGSIQNVSAIDTGESIIVPFDSTHAYVYHSAFSTAGSTISNSRWKSSYFAFSNADEISFSFTMSYPVVATTTGSTALTFCLGGADDFMLGYQLGIPKSTVTLP